MKISQVDVVFNPGLDNGAPIAACDLHPTKPWIVTGSDGGAVLLWDYEKQGVIKQWHVAGLDPGEHTGLVQTVFFYDSEVLRWKWLNSSVSKDQETFQGKKCRRNWIAVLCDNKVCLLDYTTLEVQTVRQEVFEERWLTALEIVDSSYMAVGCSDGSIRLWDASAGSVAKVFPRGAHTKAITCLKTFSQNLRQRPLLLAAGMCGAVTVWNLDTSDEMPAYRLQNSGPSILSLSLSQQLLQVAAVFTDKTLTIWNLTNAQEVFRYKNLKDARKRAISTVTYFNHILFPASTILTHAKAGQVLAVDTYMGSLPKGQQQYQMIIDLAKYGDVRLTDIKVHPLQPWLVFCVTQNVVFPLNYEQSAAPPGCYCDTFFTPLSPRQVQTFADHSGNPVGHATNNFFYSFSDSFLCSNTFKLTPEGVVSKLCKLTTSGKQLLAAPIEMSVSPSCLYLVIHSRGTGYYELYHLTTDPTPLTIPDKLKSGSAKSLVWQRTKDRFAVLSPVNDDGMLGSFTGKFAALVLIVYEINKAGNIFMLFRGDNITGISQLYGGSLLGMTSRREDGTDSTRFWSWETMVRDR